MGDSKVDPQVADAYPWLVVWHHGSHSHQLMKTADWNELPDIERGGEYERVTMHETAESASEQLVDLVADDDGGGA